MILAVAAVIGFGTETAQESHDSVKHGQSLNAVLTGLTNQGFQVTHWPVQLHPDSTTSVLLVAKPTDTDRATNPQIHEELVIYDTNAYGLLEPAFTFEPVAIQLPDAGPLPQSAHPDEFTIPIPSPGRITSEVLNPGDTLQVVNLDGADGNEIVGAVTEIGSGQDVFPRPFIISWDGTSQHQHYRLQALLSPTSTSMNSMENIVQNPDGSALDYASLLYRYVYLNPTRIRNGESGPEIDAYAPQTYMLTQMPPDRSFEGTSGKVRLRAAYAVSGPSAGTIDKIEVVDWTLIVPSNGAPVTAYPVVRAGLITVGTNSSRLSEVLEHLQ